MHIGWIGVALAASSLVLELPGQGRGKHRNRVKVSVGTPAVEIQIGPTVVGTRRAPPGHSRGKAWWKTQPGLEIQICRHPGLRGYLLANPKLSMELRSRADADGDGVLSAKERDRFVVALEAHRRAAVKVNTGAKGPHSTKKGPHRTKKDRRGKRLKKKARHRKKSRR